ncbi:hypothetical protein HC891_12375 [Candidatus Gracilibacteria bacterium]|nr:hypothetical protein [Candidatus Gracilibacteria bacterium]
MIATPCSLRNSAKRYGTPRYDALPAYKYEQALEWIEAQAKTLLPDDPEAVPSRQERLLGVDLQMVTRAAGAT